MDSLSKLIQELAVDEGINSTCLPGVEVIRISDYREAAPFNYDKGIFIVSRGSKRIHLGDKRFEYNPETFLVMSVSLPVECEIFTSDDGPFLSLFVRIDMRDLSRIIDKMEQHGDRTSFGQDRKHTGLFLSKITPEIKECACRLLQALHSPVEAEVMGRGIVNELLFRVLCGENASSLYALFVKNSSLSRVDKAIMEIHRNFRQPMNVEQLAALVNMSTSSFHRAFKDVTATPPMQYIKKVRLNKARELFLEKRLRVGEVAAAVGYESASQFSREFKRHFGSSPAEYR